MTTNEHLVRLERDLEADLLEARREVGAGRDEAIAQLDSHHQTLDSDPAEAVQEICDLAREADEDLGRVQCRLGELNYILAEEEMNDLQTFDRYRDRILSSLREARDDLSRLKLRGAEWSRHESDLDDAWHRMSMRLDSARRHLVREALMAREEFKTERAHLEQKLDQEGELEENAKPFVDIVMRMRMEFRQALPGIKALFLLPDSADVASDGEEDQ